MLVTLARSSSPRASASSAAVTVVLRKECPRCHAPWQAALSPRDVCKDWTVKKFECARIGLESVLYWLYLWGGWQPLVTMHWEEIDRTRAGPINSFTYNVSELVISLDGEVWRDVISESQLSCHGEKARYWTRITMHVANSRSLLLFLSIDISEAWSPLDGFMDWYSVLAVCWKVFILSFSQAGNVPFPSLFPLYNH